MVMMDAFLTGEVYIDFPYEEAKIRFEKDTLKVYQRWYGGRGRKWKSRIVRSSTTRPFRRESQSPAKTISAIRSRLKNAA